MYPLPTAPPLSVLPLHRLCPCNIGLSWLLLLLTACNSNSGLPVAVGTLERDRIELVAEASEPIVAVEAKEGDRVQAGDLILRLDPARLEAQLAEAVARRDQAQARFAELARGPRREAIDESRARLAAAESTLENAAAELRRARALEAADFESKSRIDSLETLQAEAKGRRDEAAAQLEALLEGTTVEELEQGRSALGAAEAVVADLRISRDRLDMHAPRDGRVDSLPYELGERPAAGAVVAVLLAEGRTYARIHVPAEVQAQVTAGADALVYVEGHAEPLRGNLRWISSEAAFTPFYALTEYDRGRLSYLAEVDVLEAGADIATGIPVEVTFQIGALTISSETHGD